MTARKIELVIQASDPKQKVPVRLVAEKLNRLQAAVVHLGDYLTGSDFRARGRSPESVWKKCTLVVSDVRIGSFKATLEL